MGPKSKVGSDRHNAPVIAIPHQHPAPVIDFPAPIIINIFILALLMHILNCHPDNYYPVTKHCMAIEK